MRLRLRLAVIAFLTALGLVAGSTAAQAAGGAITATVVDPGSVPVAGAGVRLSGPRTRSATTDAAGAFSFSGLAPGLYALYISRSGFSSSTVTDIVVTDATVTLSLHLQPASFSSLTEIGRVSSTSQGAVQMNTSTAAIASVTGASLLEKGQTQIVHALDEIPGIIGSVQPFNGDSGWNTAAQGSPVEPQIRGALPYETETLIDGHPVQVGRNGSFNISFLSTYILQNLEVVKGPGALVPDINYAIGGTLNYRTLEPTLQRLTSIDYGVDAFGGQTSNLKATGTTAGGRIGYAFDYAMDGSPGALHNYPGLMPYIQGNGTTQLINGQPTCLDGASNCPYAYLPGNPAYQSSYRIVAPLLGCCAPVNSDFFNRDEFAKIRYNFSQQTALTVSYLAGQARVNNLGTFAFSDSTTFFAPPAGYAGSIAPGPIDTCCENVTSIGYDFNNQTLFQTELRTALGRDTILARYYKTSLYDFNTRNQDGPPGTQNFNLNLYGGGIAVGNGPPYSYPNYNNTPALITLVNQNAEYLDSNRLAGYSVEYDHPVAENMYTVSIDQYRSTSSATVGFGTQDVSSILVPAGSSQSFRTLLARGQFVLNSHLNATLSNYYVYYTSHYSQTGNGNFVDSPHAFDGPRAAIEWRPARDVSWRFSSGSSIAPPYANLLSNPTGPPQGNNGGFNDTYFTQTLNSGDVKPETAFGYDLGIDRRLPGYTLASADVYETTLQNQFLQTTTLDGTYNNRPLFVQRTANLGHSRYEGIELKLTRTPPAGFGYIASGALLRAYAYDLPPGFYDSGAGPNTVNLGILPNENFMPSGLGYNGLSAARVPYAQAYGELNYRTRGGSRFLIGLTYFGSNNGFNEPAFEVLSAAVHLPLGPRTTLQLSGDNLTGAYDKGYVGLFDGTGVPLANGLLGFTTSGQYGPATFRLTVHVNL